MSSPPLTDTTPTTQGRSDPRDNLPPTTTTDSVTGTRSAAESSSSARGHATGTPRGLNVPREAGDEHSDTDGGEFEMEPIAPSGAGARRQSSLEPATASGSRRRSPSSRLQGRSEDEREMVALSTEDDGSDISDEDLHDDEEAGLTGGDRRRKQHKRHRNTQLDQRVVPDVVTEDERKEADRTVVKDLLINGALIALWYTFSLSISLVSHAPVLNVEVPRLTFCSTTSGCLTRRSSTSPSPYSQPPSTCWYNSPSPRSCSSSFPPSAPKTPPDQTQLSATTPKSPS